MNEAFLVALGALLPAVAACIGAILMAWRKYDQDKRDAVLNEWKTVVDSQREQIARYERLNEEHQHVISEVYANEARCQAELGEVHVWLRHFREGWISVLKRIGEDASGVPPLPERRTTMDRSDFLRRTAEQDSALVKQIGAANANANTNAGPSYSTGVTTTPGGAPVSGMPGGTPTPRSGGPFTSGGG